MLVKKVHYSRATLLNPQAHEWQEVAGEVVRLVGTPLEVQPSPYVQASWQGKEIGKIKTVTVKTLHNQQDIFFRLEWHDPHQDVAVVDTTAFPDGAALLFPLLRDAPLISMGNTRQPVNAWHWRADFAERGRNNIAHGLGTTRVTDKSYIVCRAVWEHDIWSVVLARPLLVADQQGEAVQLEVGKTVKVGFAVWEGSNGERAGIKAFSEKWHELTLES